MIKVLFFLLCVLDDHSRVKLKTEVNPNKQDYINASFIVRNVTEWLMLSSLVSLLSDIKL